ncbi:MAG: hypothetical protein H6835_19625 [Planctomycetes bacterium]|nr:hypothetical protein [Planctomycetota bacterium]
MSPADQRLLDAALRQLLRGGDVTPAAAPSGPRLHRWLVAALLLLGVAVPATLALQQRERHAPTMQHPSQQPEPLPAEVQADDDTLADLPAATANLRFTIADPARLADLERFAGLRRLVLAPAILGNAGRGNAAQVRDWWSQPRPRLLQPLARLEHLEELDFAFPVVVNAPVLQPLAGHPALRSMSLVGSRTPVDDEVLAALAAIPRLRALHLTSFPLDAAAMRRLAKLPLECLDLSSCEGFDDDSWQALLSMRSLRELRFAQWGRKPLGAPADRVPFWRPDAGQLRHLTTLPNLTTLHLQGCDLRDDEVAALPESLTELQLRGHELTVVGFAHLQQLRHLRTLDLDSHRQRRIFGDLFVAEDAAEVAGAIAAALQHLSLERLEYWGEVTPALIEAVSGQRRLTRLRLTGRNVVTLAGLETLPLLDTLILAELSATGDLTIDTLRPLAAAPALRQLEVHVAEIDEAAVKALFGSHVQVTTSSWQGRKPR